MEVYRFLSTCTTVARLQCVATRTCRSRRYILMYSEVQVAPKVQGMNVIMLCRSYMYVPSKVLIHMTFNTTYIMTFCVLQLYTLYSCTHMTIHESIKLIKLFFWEFFSFFILSILDTSTWYGYWYLVLVLVPVHYILVHTYTIFTHKRII